MRALPASPSASPSVSISVADVGQWVDWKMEEEESTNGTWIAAETSNNDRIATNCHSALSQSRAFTIGCATCFSIWLKKRVIVGACTWVVKR